MSKYCQDSIHSNTDNHSRLSSGSIVMLTAAGLIFAFLEYCYPVSLDTLYFEGFFNHCLEKEGNFMSAWSKYAGTIGSHDNIRFAQMSWPLFACLPKWIYALFTGALASLIIWFAAKITVRSMGANSAGFNIFFFSFLAFVAGMPWVGSLLCPVYVLNYFLPTLFSMWLIDLLTNDTGKGFKTSALAILFSALISIFHEEYSVMTGGAIFMLILFKRGRVPAKYYASFLSLFVVTCLMVFCSHASARVADDAVAIIFSAPKKWMGQNYMAFIFLLITASALLIPSKRRYLKGLYNGKGCSRTIYFLLAVIVIEGLGVSAIQDFNWRISAYSNFAAAILILMIIFPGFLKLQKNGQRVVSLTLMVLTAAFFISVSIEAWKVKKADEQIMTQLRTSETGTIEGDITAHADNQMKYLGLTGGRVWKHSYTWPALQIYLDKGKWPAIVPGALLDVNPDVDSELEGSVIRRHGSAFYLTAKEFDDISEGKYTAGYGVAENYIDFTDRHGNSYPAVFTLFLKYMARDGQSYYAVIPFELGAGAKEIKSAQIKGHFNSAYKEYYDEDGKIKNVHITQLY